MKQSVTRTKTFINLGDGDVILNSHSYMITNVWHSVRKITILNFKMKLKII